MPLANRQHATADTKGVGVQVRKFLKESMQNIRFFGRVADQQELEAYVVQHGLSGRSPNITDLVGLHSLQEVVGNFLVAEMTVEFKGGYRFEAELKVIDLGRGETVFEASSKATNWDGLDEPLFYPLLNALVDWLHQKGDVRAPTDGRSAGAT